MLSAQKEAELRQKAKTQTGILEAEFEDGAQPRSFAIFDKKSGVKVKKGEIVLRRSPEGILFMNIYDAGKNICEWAGRSNITLFSLGNHQHFPYSEMVMAAAQVLQKKRILDKNFRIMRKARFNWEPINRKEKPAAPLRPVRGDGEAANRQKAVPVKTLNAA